MTKLDFTKSILPTDAKPVAVTCLYALPNGGFMVITEGAGLWNASPAAPTTEPWATVGAAYERSAQVVAAHLERKMPASTPALALPDVSFDLDQKERP